MKKTFALIVLASLTAFGCSSSDDATEQLTHDCPAGDAAADGGPSTTRPGDDAGDADAVAPIESDADTDATVPPAADAGDDAAPAADAAAE